MKIFTSKILDYLKDTIPNFEKSRNGLLFTCPKCKALKANIIKDTNKIYCIGCHKSSGNIFEVVKFLEPQYKTDEEVIQYLKVKYNISYFTETDINSIFDFYQSLGFDLVPITGNSKIPAEKDWTNKSHKDKQEWLNWFKNGMNFGVKGGEKSNLTTLDVDTKEIPEELNKLLNETLIANTERGYHFIYQYESDIPTTRIEEFKLDIINNGKQFVIYPSKVNGVPRTPLQGTVINKMSPELKAWLKTKLTNVPLPITPERIMEDIKEDKITTVDMTLVGEGGRNHFLLSLGGILRKELNLNQVSTALSVINRVCCKPPYPQNEFNILVKSLDKYSNFSEHDLSIKILSYINIVGDATGRDIKEVVGETKEKVDKALAYLIREGYVYKKRTSYFVLKKIAWKDSFFEEDKEIKFKVPYFYDVATFRPGDMILIGGQQKVGKCFGKDTKILLFDGSIKNVQDIKETDILMGDDSKPRKIKGLVRGKELLYRVLYNKKEYIVSENHLLVLKNLDCKDPFIMSVKDFIKKSHWFRRRSRIYSVPIEFDEKSLEIEPYFLGLWLGDGSSYNVGITNMDEEVIDYLSEYAKRLHLQVTIKESDVTKAYSYSITSGKVGGNHEHYSLYKTLKDLNLLENKHIPSNYLTSSREQRLELLAGLIDSDGCKVKERIYSFSNKRISLIEGTEYLARSLGFRTTREQKTIKGEIYYSVRIIGDIYKIPVKIKRKQSTRRGSFKRELLYSFELIPLKIDDYFGFEIDENYQFLTGDFIVQHNSHIALNIIKQLVDQHQKPYYLNLEAGNRFAKIATQLHMTDGDFFNATHFSPESIELEDNAITIIDWLLPKDYAETDKLFQHFAEQLFKHNGLLFVFVQLRSDGNFFAKDMVAMFPSFVCRYMYDKNAAGEDTPATGNFIVDYIREPKRNLKSTKIPCCYGFDTKRLTRTEELQNMGEDNLKIGNKNNLGVEDVTDEYPNSGWIKEGEE